jgi:hypothetical protein
MIRMSTPRSRRCVAKLWRNVCSVTGLVMPAARAACLNSPELQPAETLWVHVDEPIVNRHFESLAELDAVVPERCVALANDRDLIRGQAGFHWWPSHAAAN